MEPLDALTTARHEFEQRLHAIADGQWDGRTPCAEWTVRDLVEHVVVGNRMAVRLLAGERFQDAVGDARAEGLGEGVAASFARSADDQEAALREPGALERTCEHVVGQIPGSQLLRFRIGDYTLHAWDLSRAIGADERLDADLVAVVWEGLQPMAPFIGQTGFFGSGPSGALGEDAPLQDRLLDLAGRRP